MTAAPPRRRKAAIRSSKSERVQRQIERFLDEADEAVGADDWALVQKLSQRILTLDPGNSDALVLAAAAQRGLREAAGGGAVRDADGATPGPRASSPSPDDALAGETPALPVAAQSFASGRYVVKNFLGEGGKKQVYLAHDTLLDRDIAFALIKTEGLDAVGRDRIKREAQAMGRLGSHPHIVSVLDLGEERAASNEQRDPTS